MRIGITCFPSLGGSGVVAAELGKALAAKGHQVHFITSRLPFRLEELGENLYFHPVHPMPYPVFETPPYTIALASVISQVSQREGLDLLHAHYAVPHSTAAILGREACECELKVVTTLHGTDTRLVGLDPSYWPITRWSIERSDGVTAVSRYLRDLSVRDFHLTRPVEVIYNFVDTQRFRPACCPFLREKLAAPEEKVLVHVSNFRPLKRVPDLIRVFSQVAKRVKARFLLVGHGPQHAEAERLARDLEVSEQVNFLGVLEDVSPILSVSDVYLCGSEQESFGLAVLEAMSCAVPPVATAVGGLRELVTSGETGYLVPFGDWEAMVERTVELLRNEDRRREMGERSRQRAIQHFDKEIIVQQYERFYERILEQG